MPDPRIVGASVIASAEASCALLELWLVVYVQPCVWLTSVSVNELELLATTVPVNESPARTGLLMKVGDLGYISTKPRWDTLPLRHIASVPICSTVGLPSPSMPANDATPERVDVHVIDGSRHVVDTLVNGPPWAEYPAQFLVAPKRILCAGSARTALVAA